MKIQLLFDWIRIVAYRKNWKNRIVEHWVFDIKQGDEKKLVYALLHYAILGTEKDHDLDLWHLKIKIIDGIKNLDKKSQFWKKFL